MRARRFGVAFALLVLLAVGGVALANGFPPRPFGTGSTASAGGGGVSEAQGNGFWVRLDGTNDPITGDISLSADVSCTTDGACDLGTSLLDFNIVYTEDLQTNASTITVGDSMTLSSVNLLCSVDGACSIGADGTEMGTVFAQIIDDGDGTVTIGASNGDIARVGNNGQGSVFASAFRNDIGVLTSINASISQSLSGGRNLTAYSGANAAGEYGVMAGTSSAVGAQHAFAVCDECDTAAPNIHAVIQDEGITLQANSLLCSVDDACSIGASGTEHGTAWVQTIDDGDGTVTIAADISLAGSPNNTLSAADLVLQATGATDLWLITGDDYEISNGATMGTNATNELAKVFVQDLDTSLNVIVADSLRGRTDNVEDLGTAAVRYNEVFAQSFVGAVASVQTTTTIADNGNGSNASGTLAVATGYADCDCNDTQGCDVTLTETGALPSLVIVSVSDGICNFADAAPHRMAGAFAADTNDTITFMRDLVSADWLELARSNN